MRAGRAFARIAAAVLLLVPVAACQSSSRGAENGGTRLAVMMQPGERPFWVPIAEGFEREHPGVRVDLVEGPHATDLRENLYTASLLAGDPSFDLVYMDVTWTPKFAAAGWLRPLDDDFDTRVQRARFLDAALEAGVYRGHLYRIPVRTDVGLLYYRKDWLQAAGLDPPATFADLTRIARQLEDPPARWGYVWQGKQYEGLVCDFLEVLNGFGGFWIHPGTLEVGLDRPEARRALEFLAGTCTGSRPISPPGVTTYQEEESRRLFQDGRAVFLRNWPYAWRLSQREDSPLRGRVGVMPMVAAPGGRARGNAGWLGPRACRPTAGTPSSRWHSSATRPGMEGQRAAVRAGRIRAGAQGGVRGSRAAAGEPVPGEAARDPCAGGAAPDRRALRAGVGHPAAAPERGPVGRGDAGRGARRCGARDAPDARQGAGAMRARVWTRERVVSLLPAAVLLGVIVIVPIVRVIALSFMRSDLAQGFHLVPAGFAAYARLWQDGRWWTALSNTAVFTGSSLAAEMVLGVAFALLLHRTFRGRGLARAIVVLPWALPTAVMALAWSWIFNDSFGVANDLLQKIGILKGPVAWLGQGGTAMFAMVVADVWKTTPFVTLIVLAGLQSIPESVLEAARVDGLGARQRLTRVVLPLLAPSLIVALAFRMVQAYGAFDLVYVMTGGGPGGATETVSLYAYQNYFRYLDFGYGSAIAVQGVIIVIALVLIVLRIARRPGTAT